MLNLDRLRVLHTVSVTGSVSNAARTLHVTTSAISQQIARLEREVGQRLVERHGRGIRLTEAGTFLARDAGELLTHVERVEAGLAEHRGTVTGTLAVAAFATAARGLLPGVLGTLRSRYPELRVSLSEREPHESIPALSRGRLDIAIVQEWPGDELTIPDGLTRCDLSEDTFDLALPADHPLAGRDRLAITELLDEDWIAWSDGQICHDWLVRTLRANDAQPCIAHTASEHATQLALVAAGLGVALIPRLGRDHAPSSVHFVPITPAPARRIFALQRTSASARPALRATLDTLQRAANSPADARPTKPPSQAGKPCRRP
ncbi:LysR family transcriptional regulator [Amycolatopsis taiwanensis]|uniref:LysR family transcriptional regulator n=1 Tax=Amycolatopsis taiwanensis TaxID=342230 RepID=UPI0004BA1083|nr:LysR family transcriptional regulator [Amycolatopsis taiwanensis]